MAFISLVCPHCSLAEAQFQICGANPFARERCIFPVFTGNLFAVCPRCDHPVSMVVEMEYKSGSSEGRTFTLQSYQSTVTHFMQFVQGNLSLSDSRFRPVKAFPVPPSPAVPDHIPAQVAKPLLSAERNFPVQGNEEAAGAMYGRALEVALKNRFPERTGTLFKRIQALADDHTIAPDLAAWAHQIRDLRNDALHETTELSRDQLTALRGFTIALLEYLYTLPERIRLQRQETHTLEDEGATA